MEERFRNRGFRNHRFRNHGWQISMAVVQNSSVPGSKTKMLALGASPMQHKRMQACTVVWFKPEVQLYLNCMDMCEHLMIISRTISTPNCNDSLTVMAVPGECPKTSTTALTDEAGAGELGNDVAGQHHVPAAVREECDGVAVLEHDALMRVRG